VRLRSDFATRREDQRTSHRFELWCPGASTSNVVGGWPLAINDLRELRADWGGDMPKAPAATLLSTGGGPSSSPIQISDGEHGGGCYISNVTGGLRGSLAAATSFR
jgi:hypothetical protein